MYMCGITGWIDWQKDLSNEHNILEKIVTMVLLQGLKKHKQILINEGYHLGSN